MRRAEVAGVTDPEDRWIEHALREIYAMNRDEPDLAATVRAAWEEGEARTIPGPTQRRLANGASHTEGSDSPRRAGVARERSMVRPATYVAMAAAALVIAGTIVVLRMGRDARDDTSVPSGPSSTVVATAERSFWVVDRGTRTREIRAGEVVAAPLGRPVAADLSVGGRVLADPGAHLAFVEAGGDAGARIRLVQGSIRIEGGGATVSVLLPEGGQVEISDEAVASVRFDGVRGERPVGLVEIEAWEGTADFVFEPSVSAGEQALHETIEGRASAGESATRVLLAGADTRIAGAPDLAIAAGIRAIDAYKGTTAARIESLRQVYSQGVLAELRRMPELWPLAEPAMRELLGAADVAVFVRSEIIRAISVDPSPWAENLLREVWMDHPDLFPADAVVAMAERGVFEFQRELDAWAELLASGGAKGVPLEESLPIALYLAQRGDDSGASVLMRALTAPRFDPTSGSPIFAAAGLGLLGREGAWNDLVVNGVASARDRLAKDMVDQAARLIDVLTYADAIRHEQALEFDGEDVAWPAPVRVGFIQHWVMAYSIRMNERARSADGLENTLRRLESKY